MYRFIKNRLFNRNIDNNDINMEELKEKQEDGAIIIDVRSIQEYNEGHIQGSINIPYYEIRKSINNILNDKYQPIVLYCQTGYRSKQAYKYLSKLGYKNVFGLYGGLDNWI